MLTERLKCALMTIVFLLGYTSLSFELIILRQMINFIGSNTLITSVVITFILLFMSVGYYLGSVINFAHRSVRRIMERFLKILMLWYVVSCSYYLMEACFSVMYVLNIRSSLSTTFVYSAAFLALPSVLLGFVTSVIGRFIHHGNRNYTGRFMAVDTMGSVLGSIGTTLVLMPLIGVSYTVVVLVFLASVAAWILVRRSKRMENFFSFFLVMVIAVVLNSEQLINPLSTVIKDDAVSRIEITEDDFVQNQPQSKIMHINGSFSSKISSDESLMFEYVKFINETFITPLPKDFPRDILILGAGGFTIGFNDEFHNYTYLDIDKDLKDISERLFLEKTLSENKKFIREDAFLFVLNETKKYDIIVVDVYSSVKSIPMNFVTADFFYKVKSILKEDGIMIANIITSPNFNTTFSRRIDNTLRYVFKENLSRQILTNFTSQTNNTANVEYVYYNHQEDEEIFTLNKNSAVFGE